MSLTIEDYKNLERMERSELLFLVASLSAKGSEMQRELERVRNERNALMLKFVGVDFRSGKVVEEEGDVFQDMSRRPANASKQEFRQPQQQSQPQQPRPQQTPQNKPNEERPFKL